jgi:DNA-binding MarR family transcriptional regulator
MVVENESSKANLETAALLLRHATRLTRRLRLTRPADGLGLSRLGILARLHEDGPATASALAEYLGLQPQSLTRLLAAVEKAGLINRRPDLTDRRQSRIELTVAGKRLLADDLGKRSLRLGHAMSLALTSSEQELLRIAAGLMDRLASAIEAPGAAPEPKGRMS